jgi:hypothetical protein
METTYEYTALGDSWVEDKKYKCCVEDPNDPPPSCDCCYNSWEKELKEANLRYSQISEGARQISEKYKYITTERDKFKDWLDDLIKTHQLATEVCGQFQVISAQLEKICTNSEKSVDAIEILFCMIRDLFEQIDVIVTIHNEIDACIKALNREELPEDSGIRKCLKIYMEKVDAVAKLRDELIKALMKIVRDAEVLHAGICSDFGIEVWVSEWLDILNCDEDCNNNNTNTPVEDPCGEIVKDANDSMKNCALIPKLTFPICNDNYYRWVKQKYEDGVQDANDVAKELVEINKQKEAIAACKSSLTAALAAVDPKELCK